MKRHIHFYYASWQNESRAWRAGMTALEHDLASEIRYVGYMVPQLPVQQQIAAGQFIVRVGAEPGPPGGSRFKRVLALPRWWGACIRDVNAEDVSLVVVHSLAALPIGVHFSRKHRLPLLYDAHELETERQGWSWPVRRLARAVESRLIRACDHVIVVNDSIRNWYLSSYPGIEVSVVRNVPVKPDCIGVSRLRETLGISDRVLLYVYCGALSTGRGLSQLIEAFRGLAPDRHLVLIGDGPSRDTLMALAAGIKNVHFHPLVPQSELIALLRGADVGLCVAEGRSLSYQLGLPNKVFEYALAGLAICVGPGPEFERFANTYPAAKIANPTIENLRFTLMEWTREEIDSLRPLIAKYEVPVWRDESRRLLAAFDKAILNGVSKWMHAKVCS